MLNVHSSSTFHYILHVSVCRISCDCTTLTSCASGASLTFAFDLSRVCTLFNVVPQPSSWACTSVHLIIVSGVMALYMSILRHAQHDIQFSLFHVVHTLRLTPLQRQTVITRISAQHPRDNGSDKLIKSHHKWLESGRYSVPTERTSCSLEC